MDIQRRIYRTVATIAAGYIANRLVTLIWQAATKQDPPEDAEDLALPSTTAVVFAGLTGAVTAVAHTLASRQALKTVTKRQLKTAQAAGVNPDNV